MNLNVEVIESDLEQYRRGLVALYDETAKAFADREYRSLGTPLPRVGEPTERKLGLIANAIAHLESALSAVRALKA